jgi:hypothetical protein
MSNTPESPSPGSRKPIPQIFLTTTESDIILTAEEDIESPEEVPLVTIEPDGALKSDDDDELPDIRQESMTSLMEGHFSEDEEAVLDQLDAVLGDGHDTLRVDSLDIDISTAYTFKGVEGGVTSPLMNSLKSSFSKVYNTFFNQ